MTFPNTHTLLKPTTKAKWQIPQRPGKNNVMTYYLEGELLEKFCKTFPKHSNRRIMQWFGISFSTLQKFKRELGLQKDRKAVWKELAKDVKKICTKNGYYDTLKGRSPSPQCIEASRQRIREGWHPLKVIKKKNPKRYKRLMEERSIKRKDLIRSERKRVSLGLTPHTRLSAGIIGAVRPYSPAEANKRYNALKRGYILCNGTENRYSIFYDEETNRAPVFERNCIACGFKILEWKE